MNIQRILKVCKFLFHASSSGKLVLVLVSKLSTLLNVLTSFIPHNTQPVAWQSDDDNEISLWI